MSTSSSDPASTRPAPAANNIRSDKALDAWSAAAQLVSRWLDRRERVDALLETLPSTISGSERARCQHLFLGVVRHFGRIDAALGRLIAHPPRFTTHAILLLAGFEILESGGETGRIAKTVHHAVERTKRMASPAEAKLVNAVVRKLAPLTGQTPPPANESPENLAEYFSHPTWLIKSWNSQFGPEATRTLLEWNQQPAVVYARWRAEEATRPAILRPTRWAGFFEIPSGNWAEIEPLLTTGKLYLQDPATRIPVELLGPQPGESILDLCAAPGGKSLLIADNMGSGRLVAVDLPGARIDRLAANLSRCAGVEPALVQADVTEKLNVTLREHKLPESYDAVLLDVPCSNTGVMRHRIDVKWRLQAGDFRKHSEQQLSLLHSAARLVRPGGRLVYSTCSIDTDENEAVVKSFLASKAGGPFSLKQVRLSFPWVDKHDGGAAFLIEKA